MVDADPQCNLTGLSLGFKGTEDLNTIYESGSNNNIKSGLEPAFKSQPKLIEASECIEIALDGRLLLLPGHIDLAEYEVPLGVAQTLSGSIQTLQNLPGSIDFLLKKTAEAYSVDYIIVDMSPSVSSINQNIFSISNFFIVPTSPDFYSAMALDSLSSILPKWRDWSLAASSNPILSDASYPFPLVNNKLLGIVVQNYRPRNGLPARAFQNWIDKMRQVIQEKLLPSLASKDLLLDSRNYTDGGDHIIAQIPDFNSLIAKSQELSTPIFALTNEQLDYSGKVLESQIQARDRFLEIFTDLAEKVEELTSESSN